VVELALHLSGVDGLRVSLLSYPGPNFFAERLEGSAVELVQLEKRRRADPGYPLRLRRWLREENVDLVHAFILGPIFWCYLATLGLGRPLVVPAERNILAGRSRGGLAISRWIYRASPLVTANSHAARDEIRREFGVPAARAVTLPNAIDLARWDEAARAPCPVELDRDRFHVALVGRIVPQKNHRVLLDALEHLGAEARELRVWLVGADRTHGEFARELRAEVAARGLGDVVTFLAPIPEVAPFLARLDALVLPSTREGFPNVALEAMALGVPVIASPVGEVPHMIDHERTGLILDPTTPEALAAALQRLRAMTAAERATLTAAARRHVEEHYAVDVVAQRHLELYRSLLERTGQRRP
jgi:glycosyltransferase involved in cell wall biosynthesis